MFLNFGHILHGRWSMSFSETFEYSLILVTFKSSRLQDQGTLVISIPTFRSSTISLFLDIGTIRQVTITSHTFILGKPPDTTQTTPDELPLLS